MQPQTGSANINEHNNNLLQAKNEKVFNAYLTAYENLTPSSLASELTPLLSNSIEFKDPFNHVFKKEDAVRIFEHMFASTHEPKFNVIQAQIKHNSGLAYWQFSFKTDQKSAMKHIYGTSLIEINDLGLVSKHIDFWDPAEHLYESVPLLGRLLKMIKKRLSANA